MQWEAMYTGDLPCLGFGDELDFRFDPESGTLRVSVFQDWHYQDDVDINLPELFAKSDECGSVAFGSYECYTKVPGYNICCDKCLATEIRMLNDMGIQTVGCCCGHHKKQGYIQVAPEYTDRMAELGYQQLPEDENGYGKWCFVPKSVLLMAARQDAEV